MSGRSQPRRALRIDSNQPALVAFLKGVGCSVEVIGDPVDLAVGFRGRNFLLEVKDPGKPPSRRKLTPKQQCFFDSWRGQVVVVQTENDCLRAIGALPEGG